ncbi:microtubule-associated protein 4 isoform X3 [Drosophila hydei]|uniref:Microtubule-associated protein n=1 Tax=Drosophila hydei TaxID=7224 RepID=A0A6J1MDC2_DROHY|nr:microtubule-associated protein 4 isoform X3 [Drosophila hydei]
MMCVTAAPAPTPTPPAGSNSQLVGYWITRHLHISAPTPQALGSVQLSCLGLHKMYRPTTAAEQAEQPSSSYVEQRLASNPDHVSPSYSDSERYVAPRVANPNYAQVEYGRPRVNEYNAIERTTNSTTNSTTSNNSSNNDFVRTNSNFALPAQMRPVAGPPQPRPPFAGARPMAGVGPRPPLPPNMAGRPLPPPLRPMDSKNNLLMGPPQPQPPLNMRPGMPPARLPNPGGPLSPPGTQAGPRPPGGFPWSGPGPMQRPPQNMTRPPPTFARPMPGQPLQAPFRPPLYNQQQQPQQQQQQQQQMQQQQPHQQPQQMQPHQQPRPPSASSLHNEDDDDVIMGQAQTPIKSYSMKPDPMGSPLLEETEPPFDVTPTTLGGHSKSSTPSGQGDNDSGVDESTQEKDRNGPNSPSSPVKTPTSSSSKPDKSGTSRPPSATPSNKSASKSRSASKNRLLLKTPEPEPAKKVPMNKVQVGHAPSPNLKAVRSKIGSLDNATYKPGGGNVKIESKKIDIKAGSRIEAKNDKYMPKGGEKKIVTTKLQWNAKSKIGSLDNAAYKPGGGDKKIESLKMDFKDKAKSKVGSKDNVKHQPGGGDIKIQSQKIEIKAQSKVGSLDNVKHKPGGGEKKIFDDKDYLKNVEHSVALTTPPTQSPQPSMTASTSGADENLNQQS